MVKSAVYDLLEGAWPSLIIFLVIVIIMRVFYLKNTNKKLILHEELLLLAFITYMLLLFELVTSRDISFGGVNLIPFKEMFRYPIGSENFYRQVVGNIILFVPFGFFATYYTKVNKIRSITLITFLVSLTIETVQKFIGRSFDIDDILLNLLGGIGGFLIFVALDAIRKKLPSFFQKDGFYNFLSILVLGIFILYMLGIISFNW